MTYTRYVYNRINWMNKSESLATPLGKTNLNRMDTAIYNIAENLDVVYNEMSAGKLDESNADKLIVGMPTWNKDTGVFTIHFYDGSVFQIDFNIEKIPVSFSMDSAGVITMTTADGTEWTADVGDVTPTYVFQDSDTIVFHSINSWNESEYEYTIDERGYGYPDNWDSSDHYNKSYLDLNTGTVYRCVYDGKKYFLVTKQLELVEKERKYYAEIKKNSITSEYLQPDYLSDVTKQASDAKASAKSASDYADNAANDAKLAQIYAVGGSGIREGENEDCAKAYKEKAEQAAEEAGEYLADLQSVQVTGVKGDNETSYRKGNVNLTADNIGAISVKQLSNENLDDIKNAGFYYAAGGNTVIGKPTGVNHFGLNVIRSAAGVCTQILYDPANHNEYTRSNDAGTWYVWIQSVKGVKGSAESTYRTGNVNITPENIGLGNVGNYKAVSTVASQGLSDAEKANARANVGAAPISHASAATTYGVSTAANYGHAMASSTTPKANGTAAVGSETTKFARGDHVHPLQTSVSGSSGSCTGNAASATKATQDGNGNNIANTYLPKSGGTMTGTLTIGGDSILFRENRVIRSNNANGIEFYRTDASGTGYAMWINNGGNDEFTPRKDGGSILGRSNARWGQIYSTNSAVSTSDRRMKHDISYIGKYSNYETSMTDDQLEDFIMGLMACIYRLNDGTSGRPHHGFIAQDIEILLRRIGLNDHAAFIKSPKTRDVEIEKEIEVEEEDPDTGEVKLIKKVVKELQNEKIPGEYIYSLRYEEFIADIIHFIQIQKNRADDLEERLAITEQKNLELEKRLEALEQLIK